MSINNLHSLNFRYFKIDYKRQILLKFLYKQFINYLEFNYQVLFWLKTNVLLTWKSTISNVLYFNIVIVQKEPKYLKKIIISKKLFYKKIKYL